MEITIYHNPRCSKSRATLALLEEKGHAPHIVEYLTSPPDRERLIGILNMLGMQPRELLRRGEQEYRDLGLGDSDKSDNDIINAMTQHPRLIERPIVVCDDRARIGRPPESVLEIVS